MSLLLHPAVAEGLKISAPEMWPRELREQTLAKYTMEQIARFQLRPLRAEPALVAFRWIPASSWGSASYTVIWQMQDGEPLGAELTLDLGPSHEKPEPVTKKFRLSAQQAARLLGLVRRVQYGDKTVNANPPETMTIDGGNDLYELRDGDRYHWLYYIGDMQTPLPAPVPEVQEFLRQFRNSGS